MNRLSPLLFTLPIATVFATALAGCGESARAAPEAIDTDTYAVTRQSFDLTVTEAGDINAAESVDIKSRVEGRTAILFLIEEGAQAQEGDVLVRLEDTDLKTKIETAVLNVEKATADEVFARRSLEITRSDAVADTRAAEVAVDLAKLELEKWSEGDVPQRRRELKLELEKAQRGVERARRDHAVSQKLFEKKFISLNDLEDSEIAQLEAEDALRTAQLAESVYERYTYQTEVQANQSALDQAVADLARVRGKGASEEAKLTADLSSKTRTLAIRTEGLTSLRAQLEATVIIAPRAGTVIYATSLGRNRWRNTPMDEGREVRFNESILLLPDTSQMVANLSVAEAYEPQVQIGQTVRVTVDARPGLTYEGTIDRKSPLTETGGWLNPGQREFNVRVLMPTGSDTELKPAMRCTGEIRVGRIENALAVPLQAVFARDDTHYVYVPAGSSRVQRLPVKIGRASDTLVEILSGLDEGQRVLLRDPRPGEIRS